MQKTSNTSVDSELEDLFVAQLRDILWAEKNLLKALPKMAKAAHDAKLKKAFTDHTKETEGQIVRLNNVFAEVGQTVRAKKCDAMEGLLKEGEEMMEEFADSTALDAALIAGAQKVEHYEIATYGTLRAFAKRLGHGKAEKLLSETLAEETKADELLTQIAEGGVNATAAQ